jgi:YesN/AraC family two-component response regulator
MQVYLPQTEYRKYMIDVQSLQCRIQADKKPPELAGLEYIAKTISSLKTVDPNNIRIHKQLCCHIAEYISEAINLHRQSFIENSLLYIKEHFKDKLTLEAVASKVFVNPKYFSHVFKQEMGVSFTEYANSLKIELACKLLATTNYHVCRISLECGFSDPSYFNRVFCAQMNMTPQTYRKYANAKRTGNEQDMA